MAPDESLSRIPLLSTLTFDSLNFYFHVHARGQIELRQRVHRLRARVEDVDDTLVRLQLELLARFLVHVWRPEHRPPPRLRRQWNGPRKLRARFLRGARNISRRRVDDGVV